MSVSDPLIKDIKDCVKQFYNLTKTKTPITDNNSHFILFVQTIEKIFRQGLIRDQTKRYFNKSVDPYILFKKISDFQQFRYPTPFESCMFYCETEKENGVITNDGRFRMKLSGEANHFYTTNSILGDEILTEILLSVVRQVTHLKFELDITNTSFLDTTWYVPEKVDIELVPCRVLGLAISFVKDKAIIVNIEPDAVAAENNIIKIGDVLDKLNDIHINSHHKGQLSDVLIRKGNLKNKPVNLRILKPYHKDSNEIFDPIRQLLKELTVKIDWHRIKRHYKEDNRNEKKNSFIGYRVKYLAKIDVGNVGNMEKIRKSIRGLINKNFQDFKSVELSDVDVLLEAGEMELKIKNKETDEIISKYSYLKISTCGSLPNHPEIFGFCAGEKSCDIAENFQCYIFETLNLLDTNLVLESIEQGFHRTHYAV